MTKSAIALLLVLLGSAYGDTLTLRNGAIVTGTLLGYGAGQISFLVDNQIHKYWRNDVRDLTFSADLSSTPASTAPKALPATWVPDLVGVVYFADECGRPTELERLTPRASRGADGNNHAASWELQGARSSVRLKSSPNMLFVVRLAARDDISSFALLSLKVKSNSRQTFFDPQSQIPFVKLPLDIIGVGGSTYGLRPRSALAAGEYAFAVTTSTLLLVNEAFSFAVDAAAGNAPACSPAPDPAPQGPPDDPRIEKLGPGTRVTPPRILHRVEPSFTDAARKIKLEGTVVISVIVDEDGHVRQPKVVRGLGYGLDEEAVYAVKQWVFNPGTKDGRPVPVYAQIEVTFRFKNSP